MDRSKYLYINLRNDHSNMSLVVRPIHNTMKSYSDLDFLIPSMINSPTDIPKIWIYADSIDNGANIIDYLRSRLPEAYHEVVHPYNAVHNNTYRKKAMTYF